jgi:hypothetical protein
MRLGIGCLWALALCGCDVLLGLSDIQVTPGLTTVYVHGVSRVAINDRDRTPSVIESPFARDAMDPGKAVIASGTRDLVWDSGATGKLYFDRDAPGEPYRLVLPSMSADPAEVEYQTSAGSLELVARGWGRSSLPAPMRPPEAPPIGATLQYQVTSPAAPTASAHATVASTGLWTQTDFTPGASTTITYPLPWASARSLFGPVYLLDAGAYDRAYFTVLDGPAGQPFRTLLYYRFDDVTLVDQVQTPAMGRLFAQPQDTCIVLTAPLAQEAARVASAGHAGTVSAAWRIEAVPALELGPDLSFPLAESLPATPADVTALNVHFGSPFGGYGVVAEMAVSVAHPIQAPTAARAVIEADGSSHWIEPDVSSGCTGTSELSGSVQLPVAPMLDGIAIGTDQTIAVGTGTHALTWTLAGGEADVELYRADLYEVIDDASNTELVPIVRWTTANLTPDGHPTIDVDPSYLQPGHYYVIELVDERGYTNASEGDFGTIDPSQYALGFAWSGLLTITP